MNQKFRYTADEKKEEKTCCICGKKFTEWGNNPWPIKDDGQCCDDCNWKVVIPARLKGLKQSKKDSFIFNVNTLNSKKFKDSVENLQMLIKLEQDSVLQFQNALKTVGEGLEKETFEKILTDKKENLENLTKLLDAYRNTKPE